MMSLFSPQLSVCVVWIVLFTQASIIYLGEGCRSCRPHCLCVVKCVVQRVGKIVKKKNLHSNVCGVLWRQVCGTNYSCLCVVMYVVWCGVKCMV